MIAGSVTVCFSVCSIVLILLSQPLALKALGCFAIREQLRREPLELALNELGVVGVLLDELLDQAPNAAADLHVFLPLGLAAAKDFRHTRVHV
jgi:hypothetical protein